MSGDFKRKLSNAIYDFVEKYNNENGTEYEICEDKYVEGVYNVVDAESNEVIMSFEN